MRLAALILALAPLATTRAEVTHVLEDFSDAHSETVIALEVVAPAPSRGSRNHANRKYRKRLETGFIIVGCIAGFLGLIWGCLAFRRARAKQKALQAERFAHVSRAVPDFQPGTNAQRRGFAHHHHCHSSVASKRSLARSLSLGSTNRSSPARPSRAVADAPPPARPHISWALPEHKSYLQTSNTHVAVCQRISLPPPDGE